LVSRRSIALPAGIVSCPGGSVVVVDEVVVVDDVVVVDEVEVVGSSVDEVGGNVVVVVEVEVVGSSVDEVGGSVVVVDDVVGGGGVDPAPVTVNAEEEVTTGS
jgi:hypothetical protein